MKIMNYVREEMNPCASWSTSFNGGGYSQPRHIYTIRDGEEIHSIKIENHSCGDYGPCYLMYIDDICVSCYDNQGNIDSWEEWNKLTPTQYQWIKELGYEKKIGINRD